MAWPRGSAGEALDQHMAEAEAEDEAEKDKAEEEE